MIGRSFVVFVLWLVIAPMLSPGALAESAEAQLAIKGYDPVAYFTEARPMVGDPRFNYEWDGAVYQFASARHLELFKADPERYAPQYGNLCTASLARGKRVISDPNYWIVQNGRLYLFSMPSGPDRMRADPAGMKARADDNYAGATELPWQEPTLRHQQSPASQEDDM